MKKIILQILFVLSATVVKAQTDIQFSVLKAQPDGMSASVVEALDLKLRQVFSRNSAAASDLYNVFEVEPTLTYEKTVSTLNGVALDVAIAKGELVLIARNKIDGAEYHSASMELEGEALGSKDKAFKSMIKNIKVTDPAYTHFINTARKKIADYYASNCAFILQKAKALYNQRRYQEAISYLSAATANIPCYDQAYALQKEMLEKIGTAPDTVVVEKVVEKPVVVEKVVEKPVVVEKVVEKPVVVEKVVEKPVPTPEPAKPEYELTISKPDIEFRLISCTGNPTQKRITIKAEYSNQNVNMTKGDIAFETAIDDNGKELERQNMAVLTNGSGYDWVSMPARVTLKHDFYVVNYDHQMETLSYVKLKVRDAWVEIRNLKVEW